MYHHLSVLQLPFIVFVSMLSYGDHTLISVKMLHVLYQMQTIFLEIWVHLDLNSLYFLFPDEG
jgi:hypothetical protein